MKRTFGNIEFGGATELRREDTRRSSQGTTILQRRYKIFSDVQKADDIEVILPGKAGEKRFSYMDRIRLVNPRITAEGYAVQGRGYTNYLLHADDIVIL